MRRITGNNKMSIQNDLEERIEELEMYVQELEDNIKHGFDNVFENMQAVHDHNVESLESVDTDFRKHNLALVALVATVLVNLLLFIR